MVALIIIGILVAILVVILLIPVGVDVGYENKQFHLSAKINGFLLQLIPKPPKSEKPKTESPKPQKEKKPKQEKEKKPKKKLAFDFNFDEIIELVKAVLKGFGKFGRKLKVNRFLLHYVAAGRDPYDTAMAFAHVNAALSALAPICAQRFTVKDCDVWTDVDFTVEHMQLEAAIAVTIRIGQIMGVGFTIAFGALRILIQNKIRLKKEEKQLKKSGVPVDNEAKKNNEIERKHIQEEERMEVNG